MTEETPIHQLSPQQATERLAATQAAYDARNANNPTNAQAKLDALAADPKLLKKLEAGDPSTAQEFRALAEQVANAAPGDRLDAALRGEANPGIMETTSEGDLTTYKLSLAVDGLRELGLDDGAVKHAIGGHAVSPAERTAAQELKARLFGDQAWVRRYLDGGATERRQATLISIILSSEIAA